MYDRILLPTDGTAVERVANHAISIADPFDATIHALYVAHDDADEPAPADVDGEQALDRIADLAGDRGVDVVTDVRRGVPYEVILDYADEADVDLVVMGTHGRSGVDRFLLGSVTDRVIRAGAVPVLAVNIASQSMAVGDADQAIAIARQALAERGYELESIPETPYQERATWIVRAETSDGSVFNVHVVAATGAARPARISSDGDGA